uniref:Uncharacterized protein n=1 Tax=Anguilla anguilla TaxID=7936 RepID=A0A0E9XGB6_ANGAN
MCLVFGCSSTRSVWVNNNNCNNISTSLWVQVFPLYAIFSVDR